jgi:hypothetical protein
MTCCVRGAGPRQQPSCAQPLVKNNPLFLRKNSFYRPMLLSSVLRV